MYFKTLNKLVLSAKKFQMFNMRLGAIRMQIGMRLRADCFK